MIRIRSFWSRILPLYRLAGEVANLSQCRQIYNVQTHKLSSFVPHRIEQPKDFSWYLRVQQCRNCSRNAKRNLSHRKSGRNYSQRTEKNGRKEEQTSKDNGEKLTIFQRFKQTYKQHGKILIGVHLVTSSVWFGSFFYIAASGVNVVALLERMGASENILKPFKSSNLGNVAVAYLMYKIATPARYTVTIAGTNFVIRYLRAKGKMKPVQESNKLRHLYREGATNLRKRGQRIRHKVLTHQRLAKSKLYFITRREKIKRRIAKGKVTFQNLRKRYRRRLQQKKK